MDNQTTAAAIRRLRERSGLTQRQLAARIGVSPKTVSKWETAKGLPDISLLNGLAAALGASVAELMDGAERTNRNGAGNLLRSQFYCCPVCGNVIHSLGEVQLSCCGLQLQPLVAGQAQEEHLPRVEPVEDEVYVYVKHEMTKQHFISFLAWVTTDQIRLVKLYPQGEAHSRFEIRGTGYLYLYCSRHGLMRQRLGWPLRTCKGGENAV